MAPGCEGFGRVFRNEYPSMFRQKGNAMRAIPECIMEFDHVNGHDGVPTSGYDFENVKRMFERDPNYIINEYDVPTGKVYAAFYIRDGIEYVSSYSWHIPSQML
jgi:hypothetical protein